MIRSADISYKSLMILSLGFNLLVSSVAHGATKIEFPDEELASESVLPVFDHPESVKHRNVVTAGRFELGALGGYSLTEPFANPFSYGVSASYHLTEEHGINLFGVYYASGLSTYGDQLNSVNGTASANLQYAPMPKYLLLANYQFTGYYGKISFTKDYVMNLSLYGLAGAGTIAIGDAVKPAVSFGLGQKFYISSNIALRFDLRFLIYQGPDILSQSLQGKTAEVPASYFSETTHFGSLLNFGAIFLL